MATTRRQFLKIGVVAGAGFALRWSIGLPKAFAHVVPLPPMSYSSGLPKYVDPLSMPPLAVPDALTFPGSQYYEIWTSEFVQQVHRDLPARVWGYHQPNGARWTPGCTILAQRGVPVKVRFVNKLVDAAGAPLPHLLPVDHTIMGTYRHGMPDMWYPDSRTVTHLHGGHVPPYSDGHPEAWVAGNGAGAEKGPAWAPVMEVYDYPNDQPSTLLWFHDHSLGLTRLNTHAGLAAAYVLRDGFENELILQGMLPSGPYEIPLVLQDRRFELDPLAPGMGMLSYPEMSDAWIDIATGNYHPPAGWPQVPDPLLPGQLFPMPSVVPEFFGDTAFVNGKIWPYLDVEPRQYRFRILNGSPARFYGLKLYETDAAGALAVNPAKPPVGPAELPDPDNAPGPAIHLIGTDGGFLPFPVLHADPLNAGSPKLLVSPGERADVIVDFSGHAGKSLVLYNNAVAPYPGGLVVGGPELGPLMMFRVTNAVPVAPRALPVLQQITRLKPARASVVRNLTLNDTTDEWISPFTGMGRVKQKLGLWVAGKGGVPLGFHEAYPAGTNALATETPRVGALEVWNLISLSVDSHPIHLHLVNFQIVSRQPIDPVAALDPVNPQLVFTGPAVPPAPDEVGWKETVRAHPFEVLKLVARFEAPSSWAEGGVLPDRSPSSGEYVWHCHILEHEEYDMMRRLVLKP